MEMGDWIWWWAPARDMSGRLMAKQEIRWIIFQSKLEVRYALLCVSHKTHVITAALTVTCNRQHPKG